MKRKAGQGFWPCPASFSEQLPGIEPYALPGLLASELPVRGVSFRFVPARYLRFRFRS